VFGKWGASPAPVVSPPATATSTTDNRAPSILSQETQSTQDSQATQDSQSSEGTTKDGDRKKKPKLRPSGVNQNGPIWGFFDEVPDAPTKVVVQDYDADALGEALAEAS
jgi:hypothetical protein